MPSSPGTSPRPRFRRPSVHGLDLQGFHRTSARGVAVGIATPAHRARELMLGEQLAVRERMLGGCALRDHLIGDLKGARLCRASVLSSPEQARSRANLIATAGVAPGLIARWQQIATCWHG